MSLFARPRVESGRVATGETFADPYAQLTVFPAANEPLLSQLFGEPLSRQDDVEAELGSHITSQQRKRWHPLATGHTRNAAIPEHDDVLPSSSLSEPLRAPTTVPVTAAERVRRVQRWQMDLESPPAISASTPDEGSRRVVEDHGTVSVSEKEKMEEDAWLRSRRLAEEEAASVPFYLQVREVRKRVDEQVAVHRGLNEALSQLATLKKQAERNRADASLTKLLASLRERQEAAWARVFPGGFPGDVPAHKPAVAAERAAAPVGIPSAPTAAPVRSSTASPTPSPTPVANPLSDILQAFSRPRRTAAERALAPSPTTPVAPKKQLPADVVRAPEEPRAYPVYRYVLRRPEPSSHAATETEISYADDFSETEEVATASGVSSEVGVSAVGTDTSAVDAVSEDAFNTDGALSQSVADTGTSDVISDASVPTYTTGTFASTEDEAPVSAARSTIVSTASPVSGSTSTDILSEVESINDASSRHRDGDAQANSLSNATLVEALREFYETCRHASRIATQLTHGGGLSESPRPGHRPARPPSAPASSRADWQALLEKDVTDVRRLRRFVQRLQKNLRAVDLQRKVSAVRQKLLLKAQALSKTRARLKRQHTATLRDVVDSDVEDFFGASWDSLPLFANRKRNRLPRHGSDESVSDEILSEVGSDDFMGGTRDGGETISDDVVDEFEFDGGSEVGTDTDDIQDEVDDEWATNSRTGSGEEEDLVDDVADAQFDSAVFNALGDTSEDGVLDEVESDVASRLAAVSDLDEVADVIDELPDDSQVSSPVRGPASAHRASDATIVDEVDELRGTQRANPGPAELSSLPSLTASDDADVSSLYPDSLSASRRSGTSSIDSSEAAYWESVAGEEALLEMERELRATKRRRLRALHTVSAAVPTFTSLYDPHTAPPPTLVVRPTETEASPPLSPLPAGDTDSGVHTTGAGGSDLPTVARLFAEESSPPRDTAKAGSTPATTPSLVALYVEEAPVPPTAVVATSPASVAADTDGSATTSTESEMDDSRNDTTSSATSYSSSQSS